DRRGARADAHIVMETNAPEARRALFLAFSALLFVASAAATILWSSAMAEGMAMPGGWALSMAWLPMPGETRLTAAAGFLAMWVAMMGAMMIPSLVPTLARVAPTALAITVERVAREPAPVVRLAGLLLIGAGAWGIVRAV